MTTTLLRLIPTDPRWTPAEDAAERARNVLRALLPGAPEVRAFPGGPVAFVDQGELFERVSCRECGKTLETAWWQGAMDRAWESRFEDLSVETPCCRKHTTLNDLRYESDAGFASFILEARDLPTAEDLPPEQLRSLEEILGCKLRQIWAQY